MEWLTPVFLGEWGPLRDKGKIERYFYRDGWEGGNTNSSKNDLSFPWVKTKDIRQPGCCELTVFCACARCNSPLSALDATAPSDHQWSKLRTPTRWDLYTKDGKVMLGGKRLNKCYLVCFVIFNFQPRFINLSNCLLTLFNPPQQLYFIYSPTLGESGDYKDSSLWVHCLRLWSINAQYYFFNFQSYQAPLLPNGPTCTCVHGVV